VTKALGGLKEADGIVESARWCLHRKEKAKPSQPLLRRSGRSTTGWDSGGSRRKWMEEAGCWTVPISDRMAQIAETDDRHDARSPRRLATGLRYD
jgi:hypothetical protein